MAVEIKVPELGESVVEATVARWLKSEGDPVQAGDAVVELETDKVDLEVAAQSDGVLKKINVEAGADVEIGDVLGIIEGGDGGSTEERPDADREPEEQPAQADSESDQEEAKTEPSNGEEGAERITPVARRMAEEEGVDLSEVDGSGSGGRITKGDVERAIRGRKEQDPEPAEESPVDTEKSREKAPFGRPSAEREERVRLSRRRRTIAARLVEAQQTAAMLTTFNEVDMGPVMELRQRWRDRFEEEHGVRLGFMSFFAKASIGALRAFPRLNAEIENDEMILKHYYDIGIAVGAEEGLVVPVLRDADRMTFAEIERTIRDLAGKARDGSLSLDDLQGGTFTLTNGGVFGSLMSTPILNPPQVGILGLHKIQERAMVVDGEIVVRPMMYLALSYDHRIVDGSEAVRFLVHVKNLIEDPERLLLDG